MTGTPNRQMPITIDGDLHTITTFKTHPMLGEYWQSLCSCGGGVTLLYRTPEGAEQAARDHQTGQRASDWDQAEQEPTP